MITAEKEVQDIINKPSPKMLELLSPDNTTDAIANILDILYATKTPGLKTREQMTYAFMLLEQVIYVTVDHLKQTEAVCPHSTERAEREFHTIIDRAFNAPDHPRKMNVVQPMEVPNET